MSESEDRKFAEYSNLFGLVRVYTQVNKIKCEYSEFPTAKEKQFFYSTQ